MCAYETATNQKTKENKQREQQEAWKKGRDEKTQSDWGVRAAWKRAEERRMKFVIVYFPPLMCSLSSVTVELTLLTISQPPPLISGSPEHHSSSGWRPHKQISTQPKAKALSWQLRQGKEENDTFPTDS